MLNYDLNYLDVLSSIQTVEWLPGMAITLITTLFRTLNFKFQCHACPMWVRGSEAPQVGYLQENNLMPVEQSAYRRNHSTETALLRVISDLLNSMVKQEVTLLGLLDLSAAFDCVDHDILLSGLERTYGIEGLAIEWIRSFLVDRTQQVAFRGQLSGILRLVFGVPQGSMLGPLLFLLYTAEFFFFFFNTIFVSSRMYPENPEGTQVIVGSMNMGYISDTARNRTHNLFRPKRESIPLGHSDGPPQCPELLDIIKDQGMKAHSYADDTQVHVSTGAADVETAVQRFVSCTERIESWMSSNKLKMNADKTQVIWIGSRQQLAKVNIKEFQLLSANILFSTTVSNLGVHLDSQLPMQDHVAAMCCLCFFQLRQLRTIRSSLTTDAAKTLAQAFVGGRLDYCNSLLYGVSGELLRRLQSVQNAAARFITGTRKYDHITPVLRSLHWLPVRQRIIFKIATLMYRCLNGLAPSYLAADCIVVSAIPGRRQLRSATSGQLYIPRTRTVTFGPRSFKICGPTIWNELPARMKDPSLSFDSFRKLLKTFLFDK